METKEKFMQKTIVVWLGALVCCLLWGSAFSCIKIGYQMMHIASDEVASQILYAGYRFTLAGILTILLGSIGSRRFLRPTKGSIGKVFKLSSLQTVGQYLLFYIGLAHTSGVKASIIEALNVFVAILVASLLFHQEKLSARKIAGCIIGFAGVALVNMGRIYFPVNGSVCIFFRVVKAVFQIRKSCHAEWIPVPGGWNYYGIVRLCSRWTGERIYGVILWTAVLHGMHFCRRIHAVGHFIKI